MSPASRQRIRLNAHPDGVADVEPAAAVVSVVNPDIVASIRSSFCNQVHFFASAADAADWLASHPGGDVVPVVDAYHLGASLTAALLDCDLFDPEARAEGAATHPDAATDRT